MRRLLAIVPLAILAGCGSSGATPTQTPHIATRLYVDPNRLHLSFRYPATWTVPAKGGTQETLGGIASYVIHFTLPTSAADVELIVDTAVTALPKMKQGEIKQTSAGRFRYFNMMVSGHTALQGQRLYQGNQANEVDTIVNTKALSFDLKSVAATPPFSASVQQGYGIILRSLKLPG